MKLRLQFNSIRLRLKRGEVDHLAKFGRVEEKIVTGAGPGDTFRYVLESSDTATDIVAQWQDKELVVLIPQETAQRWAAGNDVGVEANLPVGAETLKILVEKDFACLDGSDADNADTYPNPLDGKKC
jgi:hypothetical protein